MNDIKMRIAEPSDALALLNIYAPYVENTAVTFECDVPSSDEFATRIKTTLEKYPYIVALCGGEIIGYAYAGTFKPRAAYDWSVETSVYVKQGHKGKGVGKMLYDALEKALFEQGITNLNACIAFSETEDEYLTQDSVRFHAALGYRKVGKFTSCAYKHGRWFDMIWMEKHINDHADKPANVIPFPLVRKQIEDKYSLR